MFDDLSEAIRAASSDARVPEDLQLVVEELVTNVVKYSRVDGWNRMTVWFEKKELD